MANLVIPSSELVRLTRNALSHLYDAAYLENHALAVASSATAKLDHVTRAQRLRRLLLDCVESLRPQQHDGSVPEAARAYAILTYRYIDGMTMEDIAAKRALSERQAYRELERGLEAVAALVQEHVGDTGLGVALAPSSGIETPDNQLHLAQVEVARLRQTVCAESLNPRDVFEGVLRMLVGLREQAAVEIEIVFLRAMVGQRLIRELASRDATPVGEHCQEERVHVGPFLQNIQYFFDPFIDERHRADLDANHLLACAGLRTQLRS